MLKWWIGVSYAPREMVAEWLAAFWCRIVGHRAYSQDGSCLRCGVERFIGRWERVETHQCDQSLPF